jgi:hypothetical protein
MKYYNKLIFELSREGRKGYQVKKNDLPVQLPAHLLRDETS